MTAPAASAGLVWLASYPKSGNTWLRLLLANLLSNSEAPVPINALGVGLIASARTWLDDLLGFDTAALSADEADRLRPLVHAWSDEPGGRRFIKTHDAFRRRADHAPMFGQGPNDCAIYLIRNPLDVAISYAHHNGSDIDAAITLMADPDHALSRQRQRLLSQVRQHLGSWSDHVRGWTGAKGFPLRVVRYEDMVADPQQTLAGIAGFLALSAPPERIERALAFSRIDELRRQEREAGFREKPPGMASFFRQGEAGSWRGQLSDQQIARIVSDHGAVMRQHGYLDGKGHPV